MTKKKYSFKATSGIGHNNLQQKKKKKKNVSTSDPELSLFGAHSFRAGFLGRRQKGVDIQSSLQSTTLPLRKGVRHHDCSAAVAPKAGSAGILQVVQ